jgi:TonB family protein
MNAKTIFIVVAATLLAACIVSPAPGNDAGQKTTAPAAAAAGPFVRANGGRFFARDRTGAPHDLSLKGFAVQARTHPGTVRSHVTMEVATAVAGQSEAVLRLAVPPGAAVTSAVLWIDGRPMNGAFVERQRATAVYESIVARRRDPALVTWDGPGWIAASIFPLEQNQPRRFELEWVEPAAVVNGQIQYRVPTISDGERLIGRAELEVDGRRVPTGADATVAIARVEARPVVAGRTPGDPFRQLLVPAPVVQAAPRLVLVAETSAVLVPADRVRQRTAIEMLLRGLPTGAKVTLLAADWNTTVIAEDAEATAWPDALDKIDRIVSAGALHLERALLAAVDRGRAHKADAVLFVGAGQDGFGGDALRAPLAALRAASLRLSMVAVGGDVPPAVADAAARTGGETTVARALPGVMPLLVEALRPRPVPPSVDARGAGEWYMLKTITGQMVWIGRALDAPRGATDDVSADAAEAPAPDLTPLWHRARLEWPSRAAGMPATAPDTLTPSTALLVLENEQEYARVGLAAPEDTPSEKSAAPVLDHDADNSLGGLIGNSIGEAYGVGGLGLGGTGSGGGGTGEGTIGLGNLGAIGKGGDGGGNGSGYGRGAGGLGRHASAPDVIPGLASVRGSLDKEIIRRIVRRHINEVKYCYDQQLVNWPGLEGRVVVQFTIGGNGSVIASTLQSSTVANAPLENCIVRAVRRWEFPRPLGGGIASISYPFVLTPGDSAAASASARGPITAALAILAGPGDAADRVERVAALLGLRAISDPEVLAWTVERRGRPFETGVLVARLLHMAKRDQDAVRVLSESAGTAPRPIAAELRAMGATIDAAEVSRLARR